MEFFDKSDGSAEGGKEPEKSSHNLTISPLGRLVIGHETLGQTVVQTLLRALLWPDSPSSLRAASSPRDANSCGGVAHQHSANRGVHRTCR